MSDIQRDREERQHVIEVLKSWDGYFIGYTSDEVQEALRYAIASIKTDLKYDLLYEETSGQADKPTTKNDCEHCSKTYGTLGCCDTVSNKWVYSCKEGHEEYARGMRKFGSTTKNDLGVDCISRNTVLTLINDVKNANGFSKYTQYEYLFDQVDTMPSVTLIRPKGHWIPIYQGDEIIDYRCSECEFGNTFGKGTIGMNFCPRCGSDNREVEE